MTDLSALYQDIILDHNRRPRNYGALEGPGATRVEGRNPLCGDEVSVWVRMNRDVITEIGFIGSGCAVSRASASLMTSAVKGKSRAEAEALFERFHALVTGREQPQGATDRLAPLAGVARFPVRVKCASLAWHALRSALAKSGETAVAPPVTTE